MKVSDFLDAIDNKTMIEFWDTDFYGEPYFKGTFTSDQAYKKLFRNNPNAIVTRIWLSLDNKETICISYQQ